MTETETETVTESETVTGFTSSRRSSRTPDPGPRTPDSGPRTGSDTDTVTVTVTATDTDTDTGSMEPVTGVPTVPFSGDWTDWTPVQIVSRNPHGWNPASAWNHDAFMLARSLKDPHAPAAEPVNARDGNQARAP